MPLEVENRSEGSSDGEWWKGTGRITTPTPLATGGQSAMSPIRGENSPPKSLPSAFTRDEMQTPGASSVESSRSSRLGQLNPLSSTFQPFASPVQTMPDITKLALGDDESPSAPALRYKLPAPRVPFPQGREYQESHSPTTPGLTSSTRTAHPSTSSSSLPPFTPRTPLHLQRGNDSRQHSPTDDYLSLRMGKGEDKEDSMRKEMELPGEGETAEELGRYLLIRDLPKGVTAEQVRQLIQTLGMHKFLITKHLTQGLVIVVFFDPREAERVYRFLRQEPVQFFEAGPFVNLHCMSIDRDTVEKVVDKVEGNEAFWALRESVVVVEIVGGEDVPIENMRACLERLGDLQRLQPVGRSGNRYIAEFFDTHHAAHALETLDGMCFGQARLVVRYLHEESEPLRAQSMRRVRSGPASFTLGSAAYTLASFATTRATPWRRQQSTQEGADVFGSFSERTTSTDPNTPSTSDSLRTPYYDPAVTQIGQSSTVGDQPLPGAPFHVTQGSSRGLGIEVHEPPPRYPPDSWRARDPEVLSYRPNSYSRPAREFGAEYGDGRGRKGIPPENVVYPDRILSGLDHRTTVMIKDVPNKLSRQGLVDILSEAVPGEFDFVYLRFDFQNCCNVGYAFVNFTSVKSLYEFVQAKVGRKWNLFSSEKVLQVSYADIQGKDRLIEKFRNSTVMRVVEPWRPQIFYSGGTRKGQIEPFPQVGPAYENLDQLTGQPNNLEARDRSDQARLKSLQALHTMHSPPHTFDDSEFYDYSIANPDGQWTF